LKNVNGDFVPYYTREQMQRMFQQYNVDQSFPLLTVLRLKP